MKRALILLILLGAEAPLGQAHQRGSSFVADGDAVFAVEGSTQARALVCRFPPQSAVTAIATRGHDLYVATRSAVYRIPDGAHQRGKVRPVKLLWGIPRGSGEQGFRALAWGPQGDLYCTFGDTGAPERWRYWTFFSGPAGAKTPYCGIGGVLRCKPDGSDLRIVASGLRAPRGLEFDPYWNLFTSDIDKKNVVTRLRVTPHAYYGFPPAGAPLLPAVLDRDAPAIVEPGDLTAATPDQLWRDLGAPAWPRRLRAHLELLRRGGELLKDANRKLLDAKSSDLALPQLIWLAAQSQQGSLHLIGLLGDRDPRVRGQAVRALAEFPEQLRGESIFTKLLLDPDPRVQQAAMLAFFEPKIAWDSAAQFTIERGPARSRDPLVRQLATRLLAQKASVKQIEALCGRADGSLRLVGVLAAGYCLTLPAATKPVHAQLPLHAWPESAYLIEYADGKVDLREHGRSGTFTLAEHWKADMHPDEQGRLIRLLRKMLRDEDEPVRLQAGRFLEVLGAINK